MKQQHFPAVLVAVLSATLVFTQTAAAQQDAGQQAAQQAAQQANQQAIQQANQAAQQASQQAAQASQQANQQAMQDAQNAAQSSSSSSLPPILSSRPITPQNPNGPLPARIASAHTVLLTNAGVTARLGFDSNQLYNDIHSRLQDWGYYQLVSSPQEADLIFQLDEIDPRNGFNVTPASDGYDRTPTFRVVILDAKTNTVLWTVTAPIYITGKKTYAQWMDSSEQGLIARIKALAQQPLTAEDQAAVSNYPHTHRTALVLGITLGSVAVLGVGGYFLAHHTLNSMKDSQDKFCEQNNIPLNECAGG